MADFFASGDLGGFFGDDLQFNMYNFGTDNNMSLFPMAAPITNNQNMYDLGTDNNMSFFPIATPITNDQTMYNSGTGNDMSSFPMVAPVNNTQVWNDQSWAPIADATNPMPEQEFINNDSQVWIDHSWTSVINTTNPMPEQETINDDQVWNDQSWAPFAGATDPIPEQDFDNALIPVLEQMQESEDLMALKDAHEEALQAKQAELDAANTRADAANAEVEAANTHAKAFSTQTKQSILAMQKMQVEAKRMQSNMKTMQTKIQQLTSEMSGLQTQLNESNESCQGAHRVNVELMSRATLEMVAEAYEACNKSLDDSQDASLSSEASQTTEGVYYTSNPITPPNQQVNHNSVPTTPTPSRKRKAAASTSTTKFNSSPPAQQQQVYTATAPITPPLPKRRKASASSLSAFGPPVGQNFYQCLKILKKVNPSTICGYINNHYQPGGGVRERCMNGSCKQYADSRSRGWVDDETALGLGVGSQADLSVTEEGRKLLGFCKKMKVDVPLMATGFAAPVTPAATPVMTPAPAYTSPYAYQQPAQSAPEPTPAPVARPAHARPAHARPAPAHQARGGFGLTLPAPPQNF